MPARRPVDADGRRARLDARRRRMTDQSGGGEGVRFARLRGRARRKTVVPSVLPSPPAPPYSPFFRPSRNRPPRTSPAAVRFMDPRTGPSIN